MFLTEYTFSVLEHPNLKIYVLFQKSVSNSNTTCQGLEEYQKKSCRCNWIREILIMDQTRTLIQVPLNFQSGALPSYLAPVIVPVCIRLWLSPSSHMIFALKNHHPQVSFPLLELWGWHCTKFNKMGEIMTNLTEIQTLAHESLVKCPTQYPLS